MSEIWREARLAERARNPANRCGAGCMCPSCLLGPGAATPEARREAARQAAEADIEAVRRLRKRARKRVEEELRLSLLDEEKPIVYDGPVIASGDPGRACGCPPAGCLGHADPEQALEAEILGTRHDPLALAEGQLPSYDAVPPGRCAHCHLGTALPPAGLCAYCRQWDGIRVRERDRNRGRPPVFVMTGLILIAAGFTLQFVLGLTWVATMCIFTTFGMSLGLRGRQPWLLPSGSTSGIPPGS